MVSVKLLDSLGTAEPNFIKIIHLIIHTVYNRPRNETSPRDSRVVMLFSGKGKDRKYRSTTVIPPRDVSSLEMKIRRCNLVAYDWNTCLDQTYRPLNPLQCGWMIKGSILVPQWYEGNNLPSDEEYDEHIKQKFYAEDVNGKCDDISDNSDSESEYDSGDFPLSETLSSSDDSDLDNVDDDVCF